MPKPSQTDPKELRNFSYFEETMEKLGLTATELTIACGYGKSSCSAWRKKGKIPTPLALACECLLRRQRKEADLPAAQEMHVLLVPQTEARRFKILCGALEVLTCAVFKIPR